MRLVRDALILVVLTILWSAPAGAALCGDADGSGGLAINDVVRHLRVASGIDAATALCGGAGYADCGDLNGDGAGPTDISDTVLLLRRASDIANCAPDLCLPRVTLAGCPGTAVLPSRIVGNVFVPAGCDARFHGTTFVTAGSVLSVEPGATIKAAPFGYPATALVIEQGGRIDAVGTATAPITWTSGQPVGSRDREAWHGIIVLGRAPVNDPNAAYYGIYDGLEPDGIFGGTDADDFSGCMTYNRISFTGQDLFLEEESSPSLTLAGVGRRTVLHHIQAHRADNDCFAWYGGTAVATHLVASACGEDSFSFWLGVTGGVQFALAAQRAEDLTQYFSRGVFVGNDSRFDRVDTEPRSDPRICNLTAIGARYSPVGSSHVKYGIAAWYGGAFTIANAIVKDFHRTGYEMRQAATAARACLDPATLNTTPPFGVIRNSLFTDNGLDGSTHAVNNSTCDAPGECACTTTEHFALLEAQRDVLATADPAVQAIGGHGFPPTDLVPAPGSLPATHPAADCAAIHPAFVDAPYVGAFEPGGADWTAGWTDYPLN